ncbi:MAG TPA: cadherin-like domain-containing protein [Gammaproteobacteria bacterium]|nr:cadherin-like domain-containing protein [Gammaproteobacteria bacterium]
MFRTLTILSTFSSFFTPLRASTIYPPVDLPTLDGVIGSAFNGVLSNDQSGSTVAGVGDINGDDLSDFAIGAINALSNAGVVNVFFGVRTGFNSAVDLSTPPDGNNGFIIVGESPGDSIGFSIAAGDFNRDGISDLVVAAPFADANGGGPGKVYVIYGTRTGFNATFSLATLNGNNGFVIYGVSGGDRTGYSVVMGDVNRDGFSDLLIGAPDANPGGLIFPGSAYLVYGNNQTFVTPFQLATLNGIKGSRFNIGADYSRSGYSVAMGDFNGDGFSDLIIGAPAIASLPPKAGLISVIFGMGTGFSATVNLSSALNGTNGFQLHGIAVDDQTGISVAAGDINGDGRNEILIGAAGADPAGRDSAGVTYVLYGTSANFNATFLLNRLQDDAKGFRINGEKLGDASGRCVAIAGDINGDGLKDFMIGAPSTTLNGVLLVGTTYIRFGTNGTANTTVELSVPSSNVLILRGGVVNGNNGFSVAGLGDVNGDGLSDVMTGAKGASPYDRLGAGSSYLVYGDSIQLINNQLTIAAGGLHTLTLSDLNASVPHNSEYTQYTITELEHGQFEDTDQPGIAITTFSAQRVTAGGIKFIHDGSELAVDYSVTAKHTFAATTPARANVTFINQLPSIVNNNISINQGQTILVSSAMFSGTNPDNPTIDDEIVFTLTNCSYGVFSPPSSFSQAQILNGGVYFITFNSINPPQCSFTMFLRGAYVGPTPVRFDFDTTPVLDQNHFDICQGQTKTVTSNMLSAIHPGANSSDPLIFSINNLQYGRFERANAPRVAIFSFTQAEINSGGIRFVHDGSPNPPSFRFTISGNRITTSSDFAGIYFSYAPILKINTLALNQGQTVVLNDNMLDAINPNLNALSEDLKFKVSNVKGGAFIRVNTTQNITQFNQSQVTANEIAFRSDATPNAPSYSVSVENQCSQTSAAVADVNFNSAPSITANQLTVTGAQPVILTPAELSATDQETSLGNLVFTASGVKNGCFDTTILPGTCITVFSQQRLFNGEIRFVPENNLLPAYNMSVRDDVLSSTDRPASITLASLTNTDSVLTDPTNYTGAVVGSVIGLGAIVAATLGFSWYRKKKENDRFKKMLLEEGTSEADKIFKQEVIYPIANKIFNAINTTGCLRQRTEADNNAYMIAITKIVSELQGKNANLALNTGMKPGEKEAFLNEIARQTRQHSLRKHKKFSLKSCTRFFRAEATPQDIEDAAGAIAQDAFTWQNKRKRGISTKNTTSIELGILSDFSDNKAANEDTPGGQQLTWMQEIKREQKHQGEQLTTVGTRLTKLEQGQSLIRQSVTA